MDVTSSDLELVRESEDQIIGIRFLGVNIPQGATITSATVQFTTDEDIHTGTTNLIFYAEAVDSATTFTTGSGNISNRPKTVASVSWNSIPVWDLLGEAGPNQKTPSLVSIIQEVVNRPGWNASQNLVIIIEGSGKRVAQSYNKSATRAPLLELEW